MRKITLMLGMTLLFSSLAGAEGRKTGPDGVKTFPDVFPKTSVRDAQQKAPARIVNDEKLKGKMMYATTVVDYDQPRFVKFCFENPTSMETVGIVREYDGGDYWRYAMTGGHWHKGKYLAYLVYNYDMGLVSQKGFAAVDLTTGTYDMLTTIPFDPDIESSYNTFYYMDAMTTEPATDKLIGLSHYFYGTAPTGDVVSYIGEVNPYTGDYPDPIKLGEYYFCIEYDNDGTLWAARWDYDAEGKITGSLLVTLDPADGYKEKTKVSLTMDGKPFKMYYNNSMRFDPATDELFMMACRIHEEDDRYDQFMVSVDPKTGVMTQSGSAISSYYNTMMTGLYVPGFKGSVRGCASFVTELTSTFDNEGEVVLSWKNPATLWGGGELTGLAEVLVCRDNLDNVVATIKDNVTPGGSMTWKDTGAPQGLHTYYVIPCRVSGERGVPDSWNAFAGHDVPGKPENASITKDGSAIKLSWSEPATGAHDGWYDRNSLKYNITRYPDNVPVATDLAATSFTDETIGDIQEYYYEIEPVTADGKGTPATTGRVLAGQAFTPPFLTNLDTDAERSQWTFVDANGDGYKFEKGEWDPYTGLKIYTSYGKNDDYAISPAVKLEAGKTYKTTWTVYIYDCAQPGWYEENHNDFRFTAGQGVTAEAQTTEMLRKDYYQTSSYGTTNTFEAFFTPEKDGEYNFGFNVTTEGCADNLCLNRFAVEKVFDTDLAAESLSGTLNPSKGAASDYAVTVKNCGGNDIDGTYKVQVVRLDGDKPVVLGEKEVTGKIKSQATETVTVAATPDVEGEFRMAAAVVFAGDENKSNDISEPVKVTASPEGTVPFNFDIDGDKKELDSRMPISFAKYYSHTEAIYLASELKDVKKIYRLALIYDTNYPVDEFDVSLYLAQTDRETYWLDMTEWTPLSEQTRVYTGKQKVVEGSGNMMVFDFEEPFDYDDTKNLVVTFMKSGSSPNGSYPALFHQYNYDYSLDYYRSQQFDSHSAAIASDGDGFGNPYLPVLNLAVEKTPTGIGNIFVGGDRISFDGGKISLNGTDAAEIAVYDVAGRVILDRKLSTVETEVSVSLTKGIYVVKVTGRDGRIFTQKIRAAK